MVHLRCKHVAAILLAVLSLKSYREAPPKNKLINLTRPNIKRFAACSQSVRDALDVDLSWTETLENHLTPVDKKRPGASNYDKVQIAPKQPKSKTKNYATLESTPVEDLKKTLRSIDPNLKVSGKKKELIERIVRHRPIAPSANALDESAAPGLAALDMVTRTKKTKRANDGDEPNLTKSKRTKREIAELAVETARILGNMKESREKKVSSRLTYPNST
jgi:hypothetical protein